jgi:CRP/FNR family cyclic AMP-dependent transcriptional regulator
LGIASTDFLGQLAASDREGVLSLAKRRTFRRGQFVFRVGELKRGVYILLSGRLKFFRLTPDGREVILWFCFPGEIFGLAEVPSIKGRRVNVQACADAETAVIPDLTFNRYLDGHANAARMCRRTMAARMGILANTLVNLVANSASVRVAKLILHLGLHHGTRDGGAIDLGMPLSHQEIGNMAGVNRQTATRVLGELSRSGIVRIARRRVRIENETALHKFIHFEAD